MNRRVATVFIDALFLMLLVLVLLPHEPEEASSENIPVGPFVVSAIWPSNSQADVDLWVKTPRDDVAVGYSRLRGEYASLLRDELGNSARPIRQELVISYDVPDGEYIVNLHLYNDSGHEVPIPVDIEATVKNEKDRNVTIWKGSGLLRESGQEITVVRFSLLDGEPVLGSIHYTQTYIRKRYN